MSEGQLKKINNYTCQSCRKVVVTELLEKGTTPFIIVCPKCNGDMHSHFFSCDQSAKPDLFWFKPNSTQLVNQTQWELEHFCAAHLMDFESALSAQQQHVNAGGLVLGPDKDTIERWKALN